VRHTDNTQKEAEKKWQEAITATKEANQIIEAAISW
jgi:hypothetical protein